MRKDMTITYEVGDSLYVNVTNRCTNRCSFCIRNNGDGAYGSDTLWLSREPMVDEIVDSVLSRDLSRYREIVFCGYGEPGLRIDDCRSAAILIKKNTKLPIRINTNGHSSLYYGTDTSALYDVFDCVSISLNAPTEESYNAICKPLRAGAYSAMIDFTERVKRYVPTVILSVVKEFITEEELLECHRIADNLGVTLKVRDYIAPDEDTAG